MRNLFTWAAARIVAAFALALPFAAIAEVQMTNPVTGETETYENIFVGTSGEWNSADNWTLKETGKVPFVSDGNYDPAVVTGQNVTAITPIDGWTLRVGAYNSARITWSGDTELCSITKIQGGTAGCWLTADETSWILIDSFAGKQLEGSDSAPFKLSSANANGIVWVNGITNASNTTLPFWYYLKGNGTVAYNGPLTVDNAQVIKQADITLSGTLQVASKTLVTFGSGTTKAFSADASIKVKNANGDVVRTVPLTSVTAAEGTTLTTDDHVGSCELVQTSTGIVLYYVDGDPENLPVYKPSININFTNGNGNGLTTARDVGLAGYEVPGTSWNNYVVANSTFSTVNAIDSTGAASAMSGVIVTVSGTRGSWSCSSLVAASNPLHGYIDEESGANSTPTVTVTGIPYYKYRVLVYHSTDTANVPFGYDTINGTNYTYVNDALAEGTTAWGASGADANANEISQGGNTLVTGELSGPTLTVVGHRSGGDPSARGCIAAIQIIEVKPDAGANDLVIEVDGDTIYPVNEAKDLSGTVYITGSGALTFAGDFKISAATIYVGLNVILNVNADRLDATTFTGPGTVVYDGSQPDTTKGFDDSSAWIGTVWVRNVGDTSKGEATNSKVTTCLGSDTADASANDLNKWGNANSFVKFTNVRGYMAAANVPWMLILEDDSTNYAWYNNEGWTARTITIAGLKGDGTFWDINDSGCRPFLNFTDASQFTGSIKALGKQVVLNGAGSGGASSLPGGRIIVPANQTISVAAGKTWHTRNGLVVSGTLNVNGTLASESSSSAVSGDGTVVFTGSAPSPTGDAWWKSSNWDGTVQLKSFAFTGVAGVDTYLDVNKYGNAESVLELNNCSGWLPVGDTEGDNVCTVPLKVTGTLTINNGYSSRTFKINKLLGNGAIYTDNNAATTTIQVLDSTEFSGCVQLNKKRVVFGETVPSTYVIGQIYVGAGQTLTVPNSNVAWYGTGGITVDGELRAAALSNFGGGTTITTTDNGVLTLVSNSNADDMNTDYARIQGTGTLKLEGTAYRTISTNNFPVAMTIENNLSEGFLHRIPNLEVTIGSLAGTGKLRSDWGGSGTTGDRDIRVLQAKDTEWSGVFYTAKDDRIRTIIVDAGVSTAGTLTLSGTQTVSNGLSVESGAKVNLTGTWVGATTVAGTFGGTGTLTGDLNFSDGATFKANASALSVSGTVVLPTGEGESLAIDATGLDGDEVTILSSSSITTETDVSKVTVNGLYAVEPAAGALKLVSTKVTVTVPAVANTTVIVVADGDTIGTEPGAYKVAPGSVVTVTYAAVPGYRLSGMNEYTIDTAIATTFDPAETTQVRQYVASITNGGLLVKYTTLQEAVDAVADNKDIVLLANEVDGATVSREITFNVVPGEYTCGDIVADGDYVLTTTALEGKTRYTFAQAVIAVTINEVRTLYTMMTANTGIEAANAGPIGTTLEVFSGDPAAYVEDLPMFDLNTDTGVFTKVTDPVAAVYNIGGILQQVYRTLADAFGAAEAGQTIKVLTNNTLMATIEIATDNLTLDLNGCTVTGAEGDHIMFEIKEPNKKNVDFKIKDSSAGQTGKAYSAVSKVVLADHQNCTFTLESGTLESGSSVPVYVFSNTNGEYAYSVTISGGTLKSGSTGGSEGAYCVYATFGTITFTNATIVSTVGAFCARIVNVSSGDVTVGANGKVCYYDASSVPFTYNFTGGTFNKDVSQYVADGYEAKGNGDGTYTVCKCWIYAEPGYWDYTGTWEGATIGADKVTFQSNATYTASSPSAGQLVTVEMKLSFYDANDDEDDLGDAKAAVRLASGETEGPYQFQLYTTNGLGVAAWESATVTGISATTNVDYTFVFVLDLTNKTYTASIVSGATTNALSVGGRDEIPFACQSNDTPVQRIDFVGSGTVTSIKGSYGMPQKFVPGAIEIKLYDVTTNITLTIDQADWLNACGSMSEVKKVLSEGVTAAAFDRAYLLNLNVLDENYEDVEKPLSVTAFDVGEASVTVEVTLIRKGKLDGGINGILKLKGAADLASDFGDISENPVGDDDFSVGDTATWEFTKGSEKFYKPVIVPVIE